MEEAVDIITATITTKDEVVVTKATTSEIVVAVDTIKINSSSSLNSCILHTKSP